MMRYQDELCCGCGEALAPGADDIVVCPDCGAPMHRHCWQKEGACPLRARHAEGYIWKPAVQPAPSPVAPEEDENFDSKVEVGLICPNCGENCPPGTNICPECGTQFSEFMQSLRAQLEQETRRREEYLQENFPTYTVHGRQVTMGDTIAEQPMEEIALQLRGSQRAVAHYLERFERNRKVGWNWAAFFVGLFGPYWFFFRKLYKPGLIFGAVWLICAFAFLPTANRLLEGMDTNVFPAYNQMVDSARAGDEAGVAAAQQQSSASMRALLRQNRVALALKGVQTLVLAVAAGLTADRLLRRRVWDNIARAREDGGDGPGQKYSRHQLLIRMGGFSLFFPVLWFWVSQFLPQLIVDMIVKLTG